MASPIALAALLLPIAAAMPTSPAAHPFLPRRDVLPALPANADPIELRFQPYMDFDRDGCYNTAAVSPDGRVNPGLPDVWFKGPADDCRERNRLDSNNVYSRRRCNNGWCAVMYEYYFEKDQAVWGSYLAGHNQDWENVVVFVQGDVVKRVAPSCHGKYEKATTSPRIGDGTHAKVVYHKDGLTTHCIRMATAADDEIENHTGEWFVGPLVGWSGWPSLELRKRLESWTGQGTPATCKLNDRWFADNLRLAAGGTIPDFNPDIDE